MGTNDIEILMEFMKGMKDDLREDIKENRKEYVSSISKLHEKVNLHEKDCSPQREIKDHKKNHKWWVIVTISCSGIILTAIGLILRHGVK
jgi:hypothetical protein